MPIAASYATVVLGLFASLVAQPTLIAAEHSPARYNVMGIVEKLRQAIADHGEAIMALDDVVGIGEGVCDGDPCIRVFLGKENKASETAVGEILAGLPLKLDISGEFIASPES